MNRISWNKGMKMPQATKDRISTSRKGKPAWNKDKPWPEEIKTKISLSKKGQEPWNKNRAWSNDVKKKISKAKLVPEIKFNSLYDKLELKFKSDFRKIDSFLTSKVRDIKMVDCPRGKETLLTHIRHSIHHSDHPLGYSRDQLNEAAKTLQKLRLK